MPYSAYPASARQRSGGRCSQTAAPGAMLSSGRRDDAELRAVRRLDHIVAADPRKTCRITFAGTTLSLPAGLPAPEARSGAGGSTPRSSASGCSGSPVTAQRHAGKRHAVVVERLALEHVAHADEAGDELRARPVVDFLRRAGLLDLAEVHHRDQVGRGHRFRLVVGDVDRRVAERIVQTAHLEAHLLAQIGVEIGQRLVEQQRLRLDDQRAGERDALLLAAGQLAGIALRQRREPRGGEDGVELLLDGRAVDLAQLEPIDDVLGDRHVRPQRVALEDHRHVAPLGRQRLLRRGHDAVADADLAFGRLDEAGDQPQRRGLAAARWPEQADQRAMLDRHRDVIDDGVRRRIFSSTRAIQPTPPDFPSKAVTRDY